MIKNLTEFINEASINAKKRNIKFAKNMYINGKSYDNIGSFGIMTAENPDSQEHTPAENKKLMEDFKKKLKNVNLVYVPIDGHFGGNVEHSVIIFNIKQHVLEAYAGEYEQTSFFWCYPSEDGIISEYWEKTDTKKPYDKLYNPYKFINKTNVWHKEDDAKDNFSVIGGDFKYSIDASVFDAVNEAVEYSLSQIDAHGDTVLNDAYNLTGQKNSMLRKKITENAMKQLNNQ